MAHEQQKPMAKGKRLSLFSSCFSSCLLQRSTRETHGKCNIKKSEVIQAAPALNSEDETLNEVGSSSMPEQCFQSNIVQSWWFQLPPELLQDIAILLPNISDQVRFRAVCTAWRASVHVATAPQPSCNPCLTFEQVQLSDTAISTARTLSFIPSAFSDSYADLHQLCVVSGRICGTGHGWLVVFRYLDLKTYTFSIVLLNPLTRCIINLPSSDSLTGLKSIEDKIVMYEASGVAIALLDGSKSPVTGCIVMIPRYLDSFCFLQYTGENCEGMWTMVKLSLPGHDSIIGFAYHQGTILALCREGKIFLVDTTSLSRTVVDIPPALKSVTFSFMTNIVEASGEIFLVSCTWHWQKVVACVFRLDLTVQPPRWQRTKNIGDHVLFFDLTELQCLTLCDHVNSNLRKNCIYYVGPRGSKCWSDAICICQLDVGMVEEKPIHHSKSPIRHVRWLLPSLI